MFSTLINHSGPSVREEEEERTKERMFSKWLGSPSTSTSGSTSTSTNANANANANADANANSRTSESATTKTTTTNNSNNSTGKGGDASSIDQRLRAIAISEAEKRMVPFRKELAKTRKERDELKNALQAAKDRIIQLRDTAGDSQKLQDEISALKLMNDDLESHTREMISVRDSKLEDAEAQIQSYKQQLVEMVYLPMSSEVSTRKFSLSFMTVDRKPRP